MDMKLLGIELIDVEKANKYVEIKKRIESIDTDFADEEVEEVKPINSENPIVEEPVETNVPKEEKLFTNKKSS